MVEPTAEEVHPDLLKFRWNLNTICNWQELTGRKVNDIKLESDEDTRLVIFCGLKDEIEGFTLKDAGRLITSYNKMPSLKYLMQTIGGVRDRPSKEGEAKN